MIVLDMFEGEWGGPLLTSQWTPRWSEYTIV
jgi:hypothetical protein